MTKAYALLPDATYLLLFAIVWSWADSRGLLILFGMGGVLLLDRHTFCRLGWPCRAGWASLAPWAVGVMTACAFLWSGYGDVRWAEVGYVGLGAASGVALVQWMSVMLSRRGRGRSRLALALLPPVLALLAGGLLSPIIAVTHPPRRVAHRSPADFGLAFENIEFNTADHFRLRGWFVPATAARGTVIFCHGITANREHSTGFLPALHEMHLNVLAFDFRGHGDSDGHTLRFGNAEVEDVVAAHDYIRRRIPAGRIVLMGNSYGAGIIVRSLHRLPQLSAAWVDASFARFSDLARHRFRRLSPSMRDAVISASSLVYWLDTGVWLESVNPIEELAGVRIPVMFVHGREDDRIPFSEAEMLYAAYSGPREHFWVEHAGHDNLFHLAYREYLLRLRDFLDRYLDGH